MVVYIKKYDDMNKWLRCLNYTLFEKIHLNISVIDEHNFLIIPKLLSNNKKLRILFKY